VAGGSVGGWERRRRWGGEGYEEEEVWVFEGVVAEGGGVLILSGGVVCGMYVGYELCVMTGDE